MEVDDLHLSTGAQTIRSVTFPQLVKVLIERLHKEYSTQNDISTDLLLSFYKCFGNTFERALKQADAKPLIVFESTSGQKLWKVQSSGDASIYILPHVNYCKCDAYKYQVLKQNSAFTCKHYLSAELNFARKKIEVEHLRKFDKLKLHDISYETTTGEKLKQLILSELEKRSQLYVSSNETESKEKKFKGDVPCGQESQCEAVADVYTQTKFSPEEIDLVYCGKVLKNESSINSYNIKDNVMVHVFYKQRFVLGKAEEKVPPVVTKDKTMDVAYINSLVFQFQRLTCSPSFGKAVLRKLKKPENMKKILTACPALKNDPVALAIIKDPDLLLQTNNIETVTKIAKNHPALARCVSDLVDILFEEIYNSITPQGVSPQTAASTSSHNSVSSPYLSGEEDMELSPNADAATSARITAEQVAAALQSASGSVAQSPAITPEYVNSTMMQIMSNLSTPGTASSSGAGPSASSSSVTSPAVANPNPINPMEQYASQIQQMRELGLTDELVVVQALQLTNGDVTAAVNLVFSGTLSGDSNS
ncbi:hypothetical protein M8J77_008563 [Diaphorina citri]|nr:hypothetical protein M8J77_008563 [Diaphorina citri]